jgi:DNA (cytosine-5)-methyltransferase 1
VNVDSPANVLSLCSGAGGLDLGVKLAIPSARTVCYVEIEAYACEVLASRMEEEALDAAPIWTDLRTFDGNPWRGVVDLVIGGYPCQPFSVAGKRLGDADPRHLWPDIRRIVKQVRPSACLFENVSGHVSKGLREVRSELEHMGYRVEAEIVRAEEVGAPHRRERVFILAHSDGAKLWSGRLPDRDEARENDAHGCSGPQSDLGNTDGSRLEGRSVRGSGSADQWTAWPPSPTEHARWREWDGPKPAVRRGADGLANRVDRLRLCGNGVVPQQAAYAMRCLMERL